MHFYLFSAHFWLFWFKFVNTLFQIFPSVSDYLSGTDWHPCTRGSTRVNCWGGGIVNPGVQGTEPLGGGGGGRGKAPS